MIQSKKRYLIECALDIINFFGITGNPAEIRNLLINHPEYPNARSLTHTLLEYNILSKYVDLGHFSVEEIDIFPFLIRVSNSWVLIKKKEQRKYVALVNNKSVQLNLSDLQKGHHGYAILFSPLKEHDSASTKVNLFSVINKSLYVGIATLIFLVIIYLPVNITSPHAILILLQLSGLLLSVTLVKIELNQLSLKRVCEIGKYFNCQKVFDSLENNFVSINTLAISFFSTNVILTIYQYISESAIWNGLIIIYILATIVTLPLLIKQILLRKYCSICLSITLIIYLTVFSQFYFSILDWTYSGLLNWTLLFMTFYFVIDTYLGAMNKLKTLHSERSLLLYLKNKPLVIEHLIKSEKKAANSFENTPFSFSINDSVCLSPIVKTVIIIDLTCTSCFDLISELKKLISSFQKYIEVKIILVEVDSSNRYKPLVYSIAFNRITKYLKENFQASQIQISLPDSNQMDFNMFIESMNIQSVPMVFINNHLLPDYMKLTDIKYMINSKLYDI